MHGSYIGMAGDERLRLGKMCFVVWYGVHTRHCVKLFSVQAFLGAET
jgi:hypothetical protein